MNDKKMIFLVSLPRSGSTLLQKMLTVSPEIHSTAEPWLLLPFANMRNRTGLLAPYGHENSVLAFEDIIKLLPNKEKDFYGAVEEFVKTLYWKTDPEGNARYFLDKTPRYYMILPFLAAAFPAAKFIFLFRNPLEVLSSILRTWKNNKLFINTTYIDLYSGPGALSDGYRKLKDRSISVNYRDLINAPESEVQKICDYLDIPFDRKMISGYKKVEFEGLMGDPDDVRKYKGISTDSLDQWRGVLNTRYRKWYAKRLIRSIGEDVLKDFGYNVQELIEEVDSLKDVRSGSLKDAFYHLYSYIERRMAHSGLRKKSSRWPYFYW